MEAELMETKKNAPPGMFKAIVNGRCPVCRSGDVFRAPLWNVKEFLFTLPNCPHCGVAYEPEPGFFTGAMYVNYAFNVATIAVVGLLVWWVANPDSIFAYAIPIMAVVIVTIPMTSRISRMVMLHVFGGFRFDPAKFQEKK
jgi:uncharacterized protein (DUF983 family)